MQTPEAAPRPSVAPPVERMTVHGAESLASRRPPELGLDDEGALSRPVSRGSLRSSKSHRRIIGGVVRTPAGVDGASAADAGKAASPQPKAQQAAPESRPGTRGSTSKKSSRQSQRDSANSGRRGNGVVFRMDFDEPSLLMSGPEGGSSAARGSSLASRYDSLGAELFSMDEAEFDAIMDDTMFQASRASDAMARYYAATAPTRNQSASALLMDLGGQDPRGSAFAGASQAPSRAETPNSMKRSSSHTTLTVTKSGPRTHSTGLSKKQGGLLPDLPCAPCSGSVAWSRRLNRSGPRLGDVASVF